MLTMIIADDEKIIRESLAACIDWAAMGIEIVALCGNGVEALEAIIDESPDIVMTDIKMPGLNGLELVEKTQGIDRDVEFIILSGYKEFEFAKQAMQYGVRRYLLKPLDEEQLVDAVEDAKRNLAKRLSVNEVLWEHQHLRRQVRDHQKQLLMFGTFSSGNRAEDVAARFVEAVGECPGGYVTAYYSFLEQAHLRMFCQHLYRVLEGEGIETVMDCLYVKNSLALLVQNDDPGTASLLEDLTRREGLVAGWSGIVCAAKAYPTLQEAAAAFASKLGRYPAIWAVNRELEVVEIYNEGISPAKLDSLLGEILQLENSKRQEAEVEQLLTRTLAAVDDVNVLHAYAVNLLTRLTLSQEFQGDSSLSLTQALDEVYREGEPQSILKVMAGTIDRVLVSTRVQDGSLVDDVKKIVNLHLSDSNLSLKHIAKEHVHMNVDYLSRLFARETGEKFSHYLNRCRIEKAKQLLEQDASKIYQVADQVGCGHNPRYFSQIFKKYTGMTPSAYIESIQKRGE